MNITGYQNEIWMWHAGKIICDVCILKYNVNLLNIVMKADKNEWSLKAAIDTCKYNTLEEKNISARYAESVFKFKNENQLTGEIQTFITQDIEVSRLNIYSNKPISIIQNDGIERYVSTFVMAGNIDTEIKDMKQSFKQQQRQHSFTHADIEEGAHNINAGETSLLYLNIKPEKLHELFPEWCSYTKNLYHRNGNRKFFVTQAISAQRNTNIQQLLMAAESKTFNHLTRHLYVEAKSMELLALQIDEIIASSGLKPMNVITNADKEKLVALYDYVNNNYLESLTLSKLAKRFTLNEFKIKKGFKQLYNQTVFNYILTLRMQKAKELLMETDMTVSEVSDMIGYSSVHNFSNSFYKMYNYRPVKIRTSYREAVA